MLYTLFLYQQESGLLIYDKNFQDISDGKMELFSSFFSALKSFVSEMILDGSKELKTIELGDYNVSITALNNMKIDIVIIADKEDYKLINKIIPKIIKILQKYSNLFLNWQGHREDFETLEIQLLEIIQEQKKLIEGKTLLDKPELVLKSIWIHKEEIPQADKQKLVQEKEVFIKQLEETLNLNLKINLCETLLNISEKLRQAEEFIKYQQMIKNLKDEINDAKLKLNYYLERIRFSISEIIDSLGHNPLRGGSYRDVYLNLYSFSNKLRLVSSDDKWKEFQDIAKMLIDKDEYTDGDLYQGISKVLNMREDLDYYLN